LGGRGLVPAPEFVADTGRGDVALVRVAAADRLRVAGVVIGAEDGDMYSRRNPRTK